jgi:hypothetical protein
MNILTMYSYEMNTKNYFTLFVLYITPSLFSIFSLWAGKIWSFPLSGSWVSLTYLTLTLTKTPTHYQSLHDRLTLLSDQSQADRIINRGWWLCSVGAIPRMV